MPPTNCRSPRLAETGSLRRYVTIWVVRVGDDLYVRSYRGTEGAWFRHALAHPEGRVRAGGVERDVRFEQTDDTAQDSIDQAYRSKYARYGSTYVDPMVGPDAGAATSAPSSLITPQTIRKGSNTRWHTTTRNPPAPRRCSATSPPHWSASPTTSCSGRSWKRPQLSPKERSLVTVAALTTSGNTDQLVYHLGLAKENGATEDELIEAITHLAFYAGWPKAMAAMAVAKQVFRGN